MPVAARGLTKAFGPVLANDAVDIAFAAGEVHVLLGENGAGKSTAIGMIAGRITPDAGEITVDGKNVDPGSARAAASAGVIAVYQDSMLVPTLTGIQNARVASRASPNPRSQDELRKLIEKTMTRHELEVSFDVPVGKLLLSERQKVELVWALAHDPKALLLDEPTGLLPPLGAPPFLMWLRRLAGEGLAVGMVTHRLIEVELVADRVTVMRGGRVVGRFVRGGLPTNRELAELMVGTRLRQPNAQKTSGVAAATPRRLLEVRDIAVASEHFSRGVRDVSLTVDAGEIVGIAGIDGNGQDSLLQAIAGLRHLQQGTITLCDDRIETENYIGRLHAGLGYLSGDRRRFGIFPGLSVSENLTIGLPKRAKVDDQLVAALQIRPADPRYLAGRLSGGNQQKVALGRVLLRRPKVMLLEYPFRGLDVMAISSVRELLTYAAQEGVGIVIAASDLDELFDMCHRIVVMDRGTIIAEEHRENFDAQRVAELLTTS